MLDFYLIKDETAKPDYPEKTGLEYAGGINLEAFEKLQAQGIIEERFDFWTDFRWTSQQVKQKADLLVKQHPDLDEKKYNTDSPVKVLWLIFEKSIWTGHGLIA